MLRKRLKAKSIWQNAPQYLLLSRLNSSGRVGFSSLSFGSLWISHHASRTHLSSHPLCPCNCSPKTKQEPNTKPKKRREGERNIIMEAVTWPGEFSPHFRDPGASSLTCRRWQTGKGVFPSPTPPHGRCVSAVLPGGRLPCVPTHTVSSTVLPS